MTTTSLDVSGRLYLRRSPRQIPVLAGVDHVAEQVVVWADRGERLPALSRWHGQVLAEVVEGGGGRHPEAHVPSLAERVRVKGRGKLVVGGENVLEKQRFQVVEHILTPAGMIERCGSLASIISRSFPGAIRDRRT
jgi:hypothetical protein